MIDRIHKDNRKRGDQFDFTQLSEQYDRTAQNNTTNPLSCNGLEFAVIHSCHENDRKDQHAGSKFH